METHTHTQWEMDKIQVSPSTLGSLAIFCILQWLSSQHQNHATQYLDHLLPIDEVEICRLACQRTPCSWSLPSTLFEEGSHSCCLFRASWPEMRASGKSAVPTSHLSHTSWLLTNATSTHFLCGSWGTELGSSCFRVKGFIHWVIYLSSHPL